MSTKPKGPGSEEESPDHRSSAETVPRSPRRFLRELVDSSYPGRDTAELWAGEAHRAATVGRAPSEVRDAWRRAVERPTAGEWEWACDASRDWLSAARAEERRVMREHAHVPAGPIEETWPEAERRVEERRAHRRAVSPEERVQRALEAARGCAATWRAYQGRRTGGVVLVRECCGRRACEACERAARRASVMRYGALFAVPLKPGYQRQMVTIGCPWVATCQEDLRRYVGLLGRLWAAMAAGVPDCGIAPGTFVAGVRVVEVVPRQGGLWPHCHVVLVARVPYPYGLSEEGRKEAGVDAYTSTPEQRGLREVLRRLGLGEVWRADPLPDDGTAAVRYVAKVLYYISKVEKERQEAEGVAGFFSEQAQVIMRGVRMAQPFGGALGLTAGPPRREWWYEGEPLGDLARLPQVDPSGDPPPGWLLREVEKGRVVAWPGEGRGVELVTRHTLRDDTLARWEDWADVGALRRAWRLGGGGGE